MLKTALRYGLMGGMGIALVFLITYLALPKTPESFGTSEIIGYIGIFLSLSSVFFAVKSYRDKEGNGKISFGRGFSIGMLVSLFSGLMLGIYTILYMEVINPDFMQQYTDYYLNSLQASNMPQEVIDGQMKYMKEMAQFMNNSLLQGIIMTMTVVVIGLLHSLLAAFLFRKN